MTRFVLTTPDGATKIKALQTQAAVRAEFPRVSFTPPSYTDARFVATGLPCRVVHDVPRPSENYGERYASGEALQLDGTWVQTWARTRVTAQAALQKLGAKALKLYKEKIEPSPGQVRDAASYLVALQQNEATYKSVLDVFADSALAIINNGALSDDEQIDQLAALFQQLDAWGG